MPEQHDPEQKRSDATFEYKQDLDQSLSQLYPLITEENIDDFRARDSHFIDVSIDLTARNDYPKREAIIIALEAAKNPNDPSHAKHASERHVIYDEAIDKVIGHLKAGTEIVEGQQRKVQIQGELRTVDRWEIRTPPFERDTFVPAPQVSAEEIVSLNDHLRGRDEKAYFRNVRRNLRDLALVKGMAHAFTTALYLNLDNDQIHQTFAEEDFRANMTNNVDPEAKFPTTKRKEDVELMNKVRVALVYHTRWGDTLFNNNPDSYRYAQNQLNKHGWFTEWDPEHANDFIESPKLIQAKVVFAEMTEVAQRTASPKFRDNERTQYIDSRYQGNINSYLITSYYETYKPK